MSNDMTVATENLPANIASELAAELENINQTIGGGSVNRIKVGGKKFVFPDDPDTKHKAPMPLIILGWATEHLYYGGAEFDDQNPIPPVCWGISDNPKAVIPSGNATEKQAESCQTCPLNEWESGKGKAKACKNTRKLAVIRADSADADDPIYTISVSPTGLKDFDNYVKGLKAKNALPIMVITEFTFDEDKTFPTLKFRATDPNVNAELHWGRRAEAKALLFTEPDPSDFQQRTVSANRAPTEAKEGGRSAGNRKV